MEGRLYAIGGFGGSFGQRAPVDSVLAYDPAQLEPMPVPRHGFSAVAFGGRVYLPGGSLTAGGFGPVIGSDVFDVYTPD